MLARYFQRHGFVMDHLEIYAQRAEEGYCARIRYHRRWRHYRMEVRASDGLALADGPAAAQSPEADRGQGGPVLATPSCENVFAHTDVVNALAERARKPKYREKMPPLPTRLAPAP